MFSSYFYLKLPRFFPSLRTENAVLTAAGCISDVITLKRVLDARLTQ
jgi:hypothetical protein